MALSRRAFVRTLGAGAAGALSIPLVSARGREGSAGGNASGALARIVAPDAGGSAPTILLDSNENPHGPAPAALEALRSALAAASRYPDETADTLREAIARFHGVPAGCVLLGCGSTEILRVAVHAFASADRGVVTASPSFEAPVRYADVIGAPSAPVRVTDALALDLGAMAARAPGSGLVYLCNPNNPTASIRPSSEVKEFVARLGKDSPGTTVLVDEAYHDYVDDPSYATSVPLAMESPRVVVARTFSKVHGMAGLRVGYAVAREETVKAMGRHRLWDSVNGPGAAAAIVSLGLRDHVEAQRRLNREAKEFTRRFFEAAGFKVFPSETNFVMVDVRRDPASFRDACRARGVRIGRPFPPLATCARITIGTMDEMRRAAEVFREVLA